MYMSVGIGRHYNSILELTVSFLEIFCSVVLVLVFHILGTIPANYTE